MQDHFLPPTGSKKVLIILLGAIGDVTRALPLAMRIRKGWPNAHISWAVEPISKSIVESSSAVDSVIVFDRPRGFKAYREFVNVLQAEKFDVVLDLQRHFKSGVSSFFTRAKRRIGFHRHNAKEFNWLFSKEYIPPVENFSPKIEHYQKFAELLGIPEVRPLDFGVKISEETVRKVNHLIESNAVMPSSTTNDINNRVALIVGSSWESRFWPADYFARLAESVFQRWGFVSLLIGGENERSVGEAISAKCRNIPIINLIAQTKLNELFTLFTQVRLAVASDSGPMHIAAAVKLPVISLWGSTSPERSAPFGSEDLVLQSAIGCSPCYRRKCPGLNMLCMRDIPVEAVLAQIEMILRTPDNDAKLV